MPLADDQSILAAVAFSSGAIVAYAVAKWRENTLGAIRDARLRSEVELARREATVEAAELHAQAEAEHQSAARAKAEAAVETLAAGELSRENLRQRDHLVRELQRLAGVTPEQARDLLLDQLREEYGAEAQHLRRGLLDQVEQDIDDEARRTLLAAMQRLTASTTQDATLLSVSLPNEEMKGRLIGREGRNIRTFEQATGATLLIDETPGLAMVSCFDPVRRETAPPPKKW